jgi:hypothetical protein
MNEKFNGKSLNAVLTEEGFERVTGTYDEYAGGDHKTLIPTVEPEERMRFYSNNGMQAIVDEYGKFWIRPTRMERCERVASLQEIAEHFKLGEFCYVPHSNDGGAFGRSMWPHLYDHVIHFGKTTMVRPGMLLETFCGEKHQFYGDMEILETDTRICPKCEKRDYTIETGNVIIPLIDKKIW